MSGRKIAIMVECDDQQNLGLSCERDIVNIVARLRKLNFLDDNIYIFSLTSFSMYGSPTRSGDRLAIKVNQLQSFFEKKKLLDPSSVFDVIKGINIQPNDLLYIHFSGHGYQRSDSSSDEMDGLDEYMFFPTSTNGCRTKSCMTDDDIYKRLLSIVPQTCNLRITVDTCHSGTMSDFTYRLQSNGSKVLYSKMQRKPSEVSTPFFTNAFSISACSDHQLDYCDVGQTVGFGGSLTIHLLENKNQKGKTVLEQFLGNEQRQALHVLETKLPHGQIPILLTDS